MTPFKKIKLFFLTSLKGFYLKSHFLIACLLLIKLNPQTALATFHVMIDPGHTSKEYKPQKS